jgi:hypothetical protein
VKRFVSVFLLAGGLLVAGGANSGTVAVTFAQVGSDVVVTAAGSLTEIGRISAGAVSGRIEPSLGRIVFGAPSPSNSTFWSTACSLAPPLALVRRRFF